MKRLMLKSKIHRAVLTGTELDYEGSITVDEELLEEADILPGEQVHVLNISNNKRMVTYVITAPRGSGTILLNGPAARAAVPGDRVIILSYCQVNDEAAHTWKPKIVFVNEKNRIRRD